LSYLPTWLRASLRTTTNKWLKDTATIEALQLTTGEVGQPVESWSVVSASVACRVIGAASSDTQNVGGQETMTDVFRIVFPAGTALAVQQRITVSSSGKVYHVAGLVTDYTDELFTAAVVVRQR